MLTIQNLKKSFPVQTVFFGQPVRSVQAVDDVSFSVKAGEHLGIVGESGSGKTTVARILMGIYKADEGKIIFDGIPSSSRLSGTSRDDKLAVSLRAQRSNLKKSIQMVFQDPYSSLDPRMTVYRILIEGLTLDPRKYPSKKDKEARCLDMLGAVGLKQAGILNRYPHEFSGGERQRIAIARALMLQPKMLILDEAVSSLDVLMQRQILDLLTDLQREFNITYIFISHNLKVIKKVCRSVIVMRQGKVVESGPTDSVFHHPQHPYTQKLLKAAMDYRCD